MSASDTRGWTESDLYDDSSFHESVFGDTSVASQYHSAISSPPSEAPVEDTVGHGYPKVLKWMGITDLWTLVFDVRGRTVCSLVPAETCPVADNKNEKKLQRLVAEKYTVPQEYVFTNIQNMQPMAVITDKECQKNLFLVFGRHVFQFQQCCCAMVDENTTVAALISSVFKNQEKDDLEMIFLFIHGRMIKSSTQKLSEIVESSGLIQCRFVKQIELTVKCHYHPTSDMEILYHLTCSTTDTVEELKLKFSRQFGKQFPTILDNTDEILFTNQSHILNSYDVLVGPELDISDPGLVLSDVDVLIGSTDSMPVLVYFTYAGHNAIPKVIMIDRKATTDDLRSLVGKHFKKAPNSLKLILKDKKIPDGILLENLDAFIPNCTIRAEASNKTIFRVRIINENNKHVSSVCVKMYKRDKVIKLRDTLASSERINYFLFLLRYSGAEMDDDELLKTYHIGPDDSIDMVICINRVEVGVVYSGKRRWIVVDYACKTTVLEMKIFLSKVIKMSSCEMNLIFDGNSLDNVQTLAEAGIKRCDTVIVCRLSQPETKYRGGIYSIFSFDELGQGQRERKAILFYGKRLLLEDDAQEDSMLESPQKFDERETIPKGIRLTDVHQTNIFKDGFKMKNDMQCMGESMSSSTEAAVQTQSEMLVQHISKSISETEKFALISNTTPEDGNLETETQNSACTTLMQKTIQTVTDSTMADNPASQVVAVQSLYQKEIVRTVDGRVINAESHAYHNSLSSTDLAGLSASGNKEPSFQVCTKLISTSTNTSHGLMPYKGELLAVFKKVSAELGSNWQRLALALGLLTKDIDHCVNRHHVDLQMQAYEMFSVWERKEGTLATKEALIRGLKECELNSIAETLEEGNSTGTNN